MGAPRIFCFATRFSVGVWSVEMDTKMILRNKINRFSLHRVLTAHLPLEKAHVVVF
jgi:hypothetical protein